jgi:hypothetical protein
MGVGDFFEMCDRGRLAGGHAVLGFRVWASWGGTTECGTRCVDGDRGILSRPHEGVVVIRRMPLFLKLNEGLRYVLQLSAGRGLPEALPEGGSGARIALRMEGLTSEWPRSP